MELTIEITDEDAKLIAAFLVGARESEARGELARPLDMKALAETDERRARFLALQKS